MSASAAAAAAVDSDDTGVSWEDLAQLTPLELVVKNPTDERGQRSFGVMKRGLLGFRTNSSDKGAICGLKPMRHPRQVYEEIRAQQTGTWEREPMGRSQQHGVTCEPLIRDLFADVMECEVAPSAFFRHYRPELAPLFGASPDGIVLSRGEAKDGCPKGTPVAVLEIKAPTGEKPVIWDDYVAQMMVQMWMSGLKYAYFCSVWLRQDPEGTQKEYFGVGPRSTPPSETQVLILKIEYSPAYVAWMLPRMTYFSRCLVNATPPPADLYASEVTWKEDPPSYKSVHINVETRALRVAKNVRGDVKAAKLARTDSGVDGGAARPL